MKKLLSIALITTLGFSSAVFMPYGSYIDYSKESAKDKAVDGGIYFSYYSWPFKLELGAEYLDIDYKSNINDYIEKDVTLIGRHYIGNNFEFKLGIRGMFSSQGSEDNYDEVLMVGLLFYKYLKYNVGLNYYHSMYDGFYVNQFSPHFGINFGNYYSDIGSFYLSLGANFISISNENNANTKDDKYIDADFLLTNYQGPWATTIKASVGKNSYKVANEGFVVYNLGEEYKYSFGLDISYSIDKFNTFTIGYNRSKFTTNGNDAFSNTYLLSYSLSF